ncbi:hypothetical protein O9993_14140 [Vibrio lentus]|nr:hypothetical protein [Vibrio lentus]
MSEGIKLGSARTLTHHKKRLWPQPTFRSSPSESYLYALPFNLYKEHGIRRYGMRRFCLFIYS